MKGLIGILGGMGPAATVDIFNKFVTFNKEAKSDQEHIPLLISSIPDIPDRSQALLNNGQSPLAHLQRYLNILVDGGAECVIIPCNTAHYWYADLKKTTNVHMISIIDSAIAAAQRDNQKRIGILATNATLATGLYQSRMDELGIECIKPEESEQQNVMNSIYALKAGRVEESKALMIEQANKLFERGAETIICGCTEVPIILEDQINQSPERYLDATGELVAATIKWYKEQTR